ncbi:hypothetical protein LEMLEM_LOCUS13026, partial [Lemmus lemmus]
DAAATLQDGSRLRDFPIQLLCEAQPRKSLCTLRWRHSCCLFLFKDFGSQRCLLGAGIKGLHHHLPSQQ